MNRPPPTRPSHAYVGRCEGCGAVQASRHDTRDKETGASVGEMIASGLVVERVPLGMVRLVGCICPKTVQEALPL